MSSRCQIPDDIRNEIIDLYNSSDLSYKSISDKYALSRMTVYKIVKQNEKGE